MATWIARLVGVIASTVSLVCGIWVADNLADPYTSLQAATSVLLVMLNLTIMALIFQSIEST